MDHGGQFERKGRVMSQVPVDGVDLCDNLSNPEAVTAQTRNLNETNVLTQNQSLSPSQDEVGAGHSLLQKTSFNNNGKDEGEEQGKEAYTGRGREEDEEEDIDELMKEEEEEEEESEESSSLICCQSPDTPMTDSSYSETGSLLETPYPFSSGTSPEPTSPVISTISPETAYPIGPVECSQSDVKVDSHMSTTGSVAFTTGPCEWNNWTPFVHHRAYGYWCRIHFHHRTDNFKLGTHYFQTSAPLFLSPHLPNWDYYKPCSAGVS
ncbi:putative consortin isoform 2 [Scophthalmus maximus]|uniref:Putative consortin n=1 Tax=Scophthalmus maximus TaxID=52904 RepID=A0A2U9BCS3_SCOMX|nr:putative consortin [Scophthalmus maximus]AWP01766.1 putative consortin isoform 2 [Scophthalmus maximus]